MIRRGFWLAVGATGGIIGYRRVAALGRSLSGTLSSSGPQDPAGLGRKAGPGLARQAIRLTRDTRRFSRDVREGMDLYLTRHPDQVSPTLGGDTIHDERIKDDR